MPAFLTCVVHFASLCPRARLIRLLLPFYENGQRGSFSGLTADSVSVLSLPSVAHLKRISLLGSVFDEIKVVCLVCLSPACECRDGKADGFKFTELPDLSHDCLHVISWLKKHGVSADGCACMCVLSQKDLCQSVVD